MVHKISFLIFLCVFSATCTDNGKYTEPEVPSSLYGKWNWLSSSGGFAGTTYTTGSTGEERRIEFNEDNIYRYWVNDTLKSVSAFQVRKSKSIYSQDSVSVLYSGSSIKQSIWFRSNDTLILRDECFDCFEHTYSRIK